MITRSKTKKYSPQEYLALEDVAEVRSEYWNGEIIRLSGGTENHNTITLNVASKLRIGQRDKCCVFAIDVKVWVSRWKSYVYPDVFLICGESNYHEKRRDILTNPTLVVEVLSDGTKVFDKGDKFLAYQDLESLQEYVLIDQNKFLVEQYIKQQEGGWKYFATIGSESEVTLYSINQKITFQAIYDAVDFDNEK